VAGAAGFLNLIYRVYFVRNPLLDVFGINRYEIPWWFSPPPTSPVWDLRTFLHPDWIPILSVNVCVHLLSMASGLFFGFLARELFIEGERLPFPMQYVTVATIKTFSERRKGPLTIFSWFTLLSFIYGFFYFTLPAITTVSGMQPIDPIPKPWIDWTQFIESFLPGAALGFNTSLISIGAGVMIPQESLVIGIFLGSMLRFMIINPLLVKMGWSDWAAIWTPGMNLRQIYQYSQLYFWLNPLIGVGFAVGIVPLIFKGRTFIQSLRGAFKFRMKSSEVRDRISGPPVSGEWMIILFSLGCLGSIILDLYLIPDFPVWVLILYEFVMPFLITLSAGRMFALTGTTAGSLSIPYFHQLTIIASGYPNIKPWFLPLRVDPGTEWLRVFKICQLTKTKITSWIKASIISWILSLLVGFFYMQIFWQIAPIPSDLYPAPGITWPIQIMNTCVWITRPQQFFKLDSILYWGLGFGALLSISMYLGIPYLVLGVASGLSTPIPGAIMILVGLLVKRALIKIFGKQWVLKNRAFIIGGLALGQGIGAVFGVASAMAIRSVWLEEF